jgi:hypothetical protein
MIDQKREVSTEELSQWILERSEPRTEKFDQLIYELDGDAEMAETMWLYWGADALQVLDHEIKALNPHLRWWKFGQKKEYDSDAVTRTRWQAMGLANVA